jgi:superfamily II DNA or RNA helicase
MLYTLDLTYNIYNKIKYILNDNFILYTLDKKKLNIDKNNINKLIGIKILSPISFIDTDINLQLYNINHVIINNIILRNKQLKLINIIHKYIYDSNNSNSLQYFGIFCPCGFGKTIMVIDLICKLKLKTIIIAPLKKIIDQWGKQFKSNTNLNCYLSVNGISTVLNDIQNDLLSDCDVIMCPDKHLKNINFVNFIINNFSIVIIDEIHNYNFSNNNILNYFLTTNYFKFAFALTATPNKNYKLHFKKYIKYTETDKKIQLYVYNNTNKCSSNIDVDDNYYKNYNKLNYTNSNMYKNIFYNLCISKDNKRNIYISNKIKENFFNDTKCMILSDYKDHIQLMYNLLLKLKFTDNIYLYDVTNKTCDVFKEIDQLNNYILLATVSSSSEGIDIYNLNTIHLLLPVRKQSTILQSKGRIMRNNETDKKFYFYNICYVHDDVKIYLQDSTNNVIKNIKNSENILIHE